MVPAWLPWKTVVGHLARRHGFIDPLLLLSRLRAFAQPSEVAVPIELLRAGVVFHARGLINTKVIQQNLDWKWPFWIVRQFDPLSDSFLPRAFSITHINLTHRNWTAVGLPDYPQLPIVDPRGMITPFFDGWSLDGWVVPVDGEVPAGEALIPAEAEQGDQRLVMEDDGLKIVTELRHRTFSLTSMVQVVEGANGPECRIQFCPKTSGPAFFAIAVRPHNPEGISFIQHIRANEEGTVWTIDHRPALTCSPAPHRVTMSNYHEGDVFTRLLSRHDVRRVDCKVGLASAAALYQFAPNEELTVEVAVPLENDPAKATFPAPRVQNHSWRDALAPAAALSVPDATVQTLYYAALRTLVLHSPLEVYPGPYTYKRFWFRDAVLILHSLLCVGLTGRAERCLNTFPKKQSLSGFFHSQDGEWDSNGQVLWVALLFTDLTGRDLGPGWQTAVRRGAEWLIKKRVHGDLDALHEGLLPAGFSAEHFGNNDYYYWDDFWGVAGLRSAAELSQRWNRMDDAQRFDAEARGFMAAVERSLRRSEYRRRRIGLPASPYRRLDAGAVGSLVAGYPLRLVAPHDPRLLDTVAFLRENCMVHGAFFQDMIHSGINVYLTLHMAQVLLRAGDPDFFQLVQAVARLASPTGQWPEAIHPRTGGGCMGDGQHAWAAAEWVMVIRNMFVREEGDGLVLASGVPEQWLESGQSLSFGPTLTPYGSVTVRITPESDAVHVAWHADWRNGIPPLSVRLPGGEAYTMEAGGANEIRVPRRHAGAQQGSRSL
jgi:hypothetical protein